VVFLALVAVPVLAQQAQDERHLTDIASSVGIAQGVPGGGMPTMEIMPMMIRQNGAMGGMPIMTGMASHVEGRLAFLKTELKITEAQLPLWYAAVDAVCANTNASATCRDGMVRGADRTTTLSDKLAMPDK
jgi:hypothetical protein